MFARDWDDPSRGMQASEGEPRRIGLVARHDRHRGVAAMQARGSMNIGFDQPVERYQRMTCRPDLIGQGRDAVIVINRGK